MAPRRTAPTPRRAPRTVHVDMHGFIGNLVADLREELGGEPEEAREPLPSLFTLVEGETA